MRPPYRRKLASPRISSTYPQITKMKLRSFKEKCICEKKAQTSENFKLFALKNSGYFCDKILMSSDLQEIPVHPLVMASLSPSFSLMMKTPNTIIIIPFNKKIIEIIVKFAYTGSCRVDESTIMETLEAADKYKIEELIQLSGDFLVSSALNVPNALKFYDLSAKFCCDHVTGRISQFICQNFKSFIATDEALSFTAEKLLTFFQSADLQMKVEELEQFLQAWAETNVDTFTTAQMEVIMKSIPLKRIPSKVVLATGGQPFQSLYPTDVIETFNYLTNSWSINHMKLPIRSAGHGVVELEGKLYVAGGHDGKEYLDSLYSLDMSTMVWEEMSSMMSKRSYIAAVIFNGKIIVLGGRDETSVLKTVEMYDPNTNMWIEMPNMNQRRSHFGATVFEGKLFAVGGIADGRNILSSVEYFCPIENVWIESSPLPTPRYGATAMAMEDKIFVLGGSSDGLARLKSVECFQPGISRTEWLTVPDMMYRRTCSSSFVFEGKLVVAGGVEVGGDVEEYCSKDKKWITISNLNIKKYGIGCIALCSSF